MHSLRNIELASQGLISIFNNDERYSGFTSHFSINEPICTFNKFCPIIVPTNTIENNECLIIVSDDGVTIILQKK